MKISFRLWAALCLIGLLHAGAQAQPTDYTHYYPFSGNANDAVSWLNATSVNATLTTGIDGVANSAYEFASTSYIQYGGSLTGSSTWTISFYIKITNASSGGYIFVDPLKYGLWYSPDGSLKWTSGGSVVQTTSSGKISPDTWYHIAIVNGTGIYINGEFYFWRCSIDYYGSKPYYFGDRNGIGSFTGVLDEVKVYARNLTQDEVTQLAGLLPPVFQNPIEYTYDEVGNRIKRSTIVMKSAKADSASNAKNSFAGEGFGSEVYTESLGTYKVAAYPNPTLGMLRVELKGGDRQPRPAIYLYNLDGRLLLSKTGANSSNDIDLSPFPVGSYIMRVTVDGMAKEWKIIKE